ncbi:unnamed protein product [Sympodiomycopsis kandeliae]
MEFVSDWMACQSLDNGNPSADLEGPVDQTLRKLHSLHTNGVNTKNEQNGIIRSLEAKLEQAYPQQGLSIVAFGSTANGLQTKSSDFDLCIVDPSRPKGKWTTDLGQEPLPNGVKSTYRVGDVYLQPWYNVDVLGPILGRSRLVEKYECIRATVPLVRLTMRNTARQVDVVVNNAFGRLNTTLIRAYVSLRPTTLPQLYFAVKYWFKNRGLNYTRGGEAEDQGDGKKLRTLSSYAIAIMVIRYLQTKGKLPNLQGGRLVEHLPDRLWDYDCHIEGYEKYNIPASIKSDPVALAKRYPTEHFTHWDASFIDPLGRDREHFAVKHDKAGFHIVVPRDPIDDVYDESDDDRFRPESKKNDAELGSLFIGFIQWLSMVLMDRRAISISLHQTYLLTEPRCCKCCGRKSPIPNHWRNKDLVIVDPLIGDKNVATGLYDPRAIQLLKREVSRAYLMVLDRYNFDYFELVRPE